MASAAKALGTTVEGSVRRLIFVLGDQLDEGHPGLVDSYRDAVFMAEVDSETTSPPSHRQRTTLFLSAMRHFGLDLMERGHRLRYVKVDAPGNRGSLEGELIRAIEALEPESVMLIEPGDHRVSGRVREVTSTMAVGLEVGEDESFTCSGAEFDAWADDGRKALTMEYFYRKRRRDLEVLVDAEGDPVGGRWNFDHDNRATFSAPPQVPDPYRPRIDAVTREVMELVARRWPQAPGRMERFEWPVTHSQAKRALASFIDRRLEGFGTYEDAMWSGEPVLHHSKLASSLNLKLLDPDECVRAALVAYERDSLPLNDVEAFVRQIIGWREFIRGVYRREGPSYRESNGLDHQGRLPEFFWSGETDMRCLSGCIGDVLEHGWGHHIARLMVIGNFALMAGVEPVRVDDWFLGMYVDGVDWVTTPNVIGMSQHADEGLVATKPYVASGRYIARMSNYCSGCRYDVSERTGDRACPFNALYWDFLARHRHHFASNPRMGLSLRNLDRLESEELVSIRKRARGLRESWGVD